MNVMYVFDDSHKLDHEHIAFIYDDEFYLVNTIVGKVNFGYTEENLMAECADRYGRVDEPAHDPLEDFVAEGNRRDAQGDPDYRYYDVPVTETQRETEDRQAQTAAGQYGGIAIRETDTAALNAAGCQYVEYEWVNMEDYGYSTSKSMEWVGKDGHVLTVICDRYYLVI